MGDQVQEHSAAIRPASRTEDRVAVKIGTSSPFFM
jgi:hypothetical protein